MRAIQVEEDVVRKFGFAQGPSLLAQRQLPRPIAFTRLHATATAGERTKSAAPDAAFVLLVALAPMAGGEIWIDGTHDALPPACPGDTFVFNLAGSPLVHFAEPYDFVRFYLPNATLDRLADDQGLPRVPGLRTTPLRVRDPVMQGLALSLLPVLETPHAGATQFLDSVALACHAHVMRSCSGVPASGCYAGPGLAHWQLRRVRAYADANLEADPSIADLARECRLLPGLFPHRAALRRINAWSVYGSSGLRSCCLAAIISYRKLPLCAASWTKATSPECSGDSKGRAQVGGVGSTATRSCRRPR